MPAPSAARLMLATIKRADLVLPCDPEREVISYLGCVVALEPAQTCCAPKPTRCAKDDCACLAQYGPWVVADAGVGPDQRRCEWYPTILCTLGVDGGSAFVKCTRP